MVCVLEAARLSWWRIGLFLLLLSPSQALVLLLALLLLDRLWLLLFDDIVDVGTLGLLASRVAVENDEAVGRQALRRVRRPHLVTRDVLLSIAAFALDGNLLYALIRWTRR